MGGSWRAGLIGRTDSTGRCHDREGEQARQAERFAVPLLASVLDGTAAAPVGRRMCLVPGFCCCCKSHEMAGPTDLGACMVARSTVLY